MCILDGNHITRNVLFHLWKTDGVWPRHQRWVNLYHNWGFNGNSSFKHGQNLIKRHAEAPKIREKYPNSILDQYGRTTLTLLPQPPIFLETLSVRDMDMEAEFLGLFSVSKVLDLLAQWSVFFMSTVILWCMISLCNPISWKHTANRACAERALNKLIGSQLW